MYCNHPQYVITGRPVMKMGITASVGLKNFVPSGTDLALLTMCDHVIISHGTYGMWAAFLASSTKTHIMAHNLTDVPNPQKEVMEEISAVKNANFSNIIFMDNK